MPPPGLAWGHGPQHTDAAVPIGFEQPQVLRTDRQMGRDKGDSRTDLASCRNLALSSGGRVSRQDFTATGVLSARRRPLNTSPKLPCRETWVQRHNLPRCGPRQPLPSRRPCTERDQSTLTHPADALPQQHVLVVEHPFVLQQVDTEGGEPSPSLPQAHIPPCPCRSLSQSPGGGVPTPPVPSLPTG